MNEVWGCWVLEQKDKSVGTAVLFGAPTHTWCSPITLDIYCEGPTPSSAWCCHLQAERARVCPSAGTLSPQSQPIKSGRPMVAALSFGLENWFLFDEFLQFLVAKVVLSQKSTLYRAEKAQSFHAFLVTLSQRQQ